MAGVEWVVDQINLFSPLIAGQILNAYYQALVLKRMCGVEITKAVEEQMLTEILSQLEHIQQAVEARYPRRLVSIGTAVE